MALSASTLQDALVKLMDPSAKLTFAGFPSSYAAAASNFADAYDQYAQNAVDSLGNGPLLVNKSGFAAALMFNPTTPAKPGNPGATPPVPPVPAHAATPAEAALIIDTAWTAYWTGGTLNVTTPPTGMAPVSNLTFAIPGTLQALILPVLQATYSSGADAAQAWATAYHSATILVTTVFAFTTPAGAPGALPGVLA